MLRNDQPYRDPGGDYYDRKDPDATRRRAVAQLRRLGFHVELSKSMYPAPIRAGPHRQGLPK
jgi:hypothetical protein